MSDQTNLVLGPVRISFPHLFTPKAPKGSDKEQYSLMCVFDPTTKDGKRLLREIEAAIEAAETEGASKLEKTPLKKQRRPLKDGDDEFPGDPYFAGKKILQCNNTKQPDIVDKKKQPIIDEDEVYPGMWAYVHVNMFAYNNVGVGISASLQNVMKVKDDARLDSRVSAAKAFENVDFPDDDDDDLPPAKKKAAADDDDDLPPKKKAAVDDDDDLPPKKKSKYE